MNSPGRTLSGRATLAGVIGWPVGHSLSPALHGYWLDRYAIDGAYVPLPVAPENLGTALRALPALGFAGVNVTVPHKQAVAAAVDTLDDAARRIGAVNTVIVADDGKLVGRNTDGIGFINALHAGATGWSASAGPTVLLGAGGAARAICAALLDAGAPEVRIVNRTKQKADQIAADLGGPIQTLAWNDRDRSLENAGLLVNATTLGMTGADPLPISLDLLPASAVVTDIVYAPLETPLLAAARARGNVAVDGLGMLLHQACPAFAAWFGVEPEVTDALRNHVLNQLRAD